jgi:hypothetical protein
MKATDVTEAAKLLERRGELLKLIPKVSAINDLTKPVVVYFRGYTSEDLHTVMRESKVTSEEVASVISNFLLTEVERQFARNTERLAELGVELDT